MKNIQYGFGLGLVSLIIGAFTSPALAIPPAERPQPPTKVATTRPTIPPTVAPPTPRDSVPVTCTIKYVHGDIASGPVSAQKCSTLVSVATSSGTFNYPVSCMIRSGENSCAAKLVFQTGRHILPPDSKIVNVQTFAEKIYGAKEQEAGCIYSDGKVLTSPLFDQNRTLYGVNTYHLLYCERPLVVSPPSPTVLPRQ